MRRDIAQNDGTCSDLGEIADSDSAEHGGPRRKQNTSADPRGRVIGVVTADRHVLKHGRAVSDLDERSHDYAGRVVEKNGPSYPSRGMYAHLERTRAFALQPNSEIAPIGRPTLVRQTIGLQSDITLVVQQRG